MTAPSGVHAIWEEVERAAQHYYHTPLQLGIDRRTKQFIVDRCLPFVRGPRVLDLGYVDGQWADLLLQQGLLVDIVEGASSHVDAARQRYAHNPSVRVFHALFQSFQPDTSYDTIIAGDMVRYLDEPEHFLRLASRWLQDAGHLIVTVPNSRSLHRRIGSLMNLEPAPTRPNARDVEVGNRRSYDRYEFRHLLLNSGLDILALHGCFLKPLSSVQMEHWSDDLLRAFCHLGDELEDYAWFLYAICRRGPR